MLLAAAALAFAAPAIAGPVSIINGNFEGDEVESETITGWTIAIGQDDRVELANGQGYFDCCGGVGSAPALANQFVAFGAGEAGNDGIVSQSFATDSALHYQVSFDVGAFAGDQTVTGSVVDTVTNAVLGSLVFTKSGSTDFDAMFGTVTFGFQGTGNAVSLRFTAAGSDTGSRDALLDNVSVASVPEPTSWAMLVAGFGLAGGAMRSRRKPAIRLA